MVAGDKINDAIDEQLEKVKGIILLWSRISVKSHWVRGEAYGEAVSSNWAIVRGLAYVLVCIAQEQPGHVERP
jgi:hypothetical protein